MAHHGNTPESVLNAPEKTVEVKSAQDGLSRAERRHGLAFKHSDERIAERIAAGRNRPYVTPKD